MKLTWLDGDEKASGNRFGEQYACPACHDYGFIHPRKPEGGTDWSQVVRCRCKTDEDRWERMRRFLTMCELPSATEDMTFESFERFPDLDLAYRLALAVAEGTEEWLVLIGGVDSGKTHLAIAICRRWLQRQQPARYAWVPGLLDELRAGYNAKEDLRDGFDYRFKVYCTVPLLVLDDLGAERPSLWATEKLTTIIHSRLVAGLPLVVTTNKPLDELPGDEDHRIASRLQRHPRAKVIVLDVPEYRLRRGTGAKRPPPKENNDGL